MRKVKNICFPRRLYSVLLNNSWPGGDAAAQQGHDPDDAAGGQSADPAARAQRPAAGALRPARPRPAQAPQPSDHGLMVVKAGESVCQTLLLTKTMVHAYMSA